MVAFASGIGSVMLTTLVLLRAAAGRPMSASLTLLLWVGVLDIAYLLAMLTLWWDEKKRTRAAEAEIERRPISLADDSTWEQRLDLGANKITFNLRSTVARDVQNLQISVETPTGQCCTRPCFNDWYRNSGLMIGVDFPHQFSDAPKLINGPYKVKWEGEISGTHRVLATASFDVHLKA